MNAKERYLKIAQDEKGRYGLEHSDGSPCDAKRPENCPRNRKAQRADDISGARGGSGGGSGGVLSWDGKLDDMPSKELDRVVDSFMKDHADEIYDAVGDGGGTYVRAERGVRSLDPADYSAREYDVRKLIDGDQIAEEVVDALPNESKDLDAKKVVGEVANRLTKWLDGLPGDQLGKGTPL